jgi:hypothetical protein
VISYHVGILFLGFMDSKLFDFRKKDRDLQCARLAINHVYVAKGK